MKSLILRVAVLASGVVISFFFLMALLDVSSSPMLLLTRSVYYFLLPILALTLMVRFSVAFYIMLALLLLGIRIFAGESDVEALPLFNYLVTALAVVRLMINKGRESFREMLSPVLILYISLAVLRYIIEPALPSFGVGEGTGFKQYFRFYATLIPFFVLPYMVSRAMLEKLPERLFVLATVALVVKVVFFYLDVPALSAMFGIRSADEFEGRMSFLAEPARVLWMSSVVLASSRVRPRMKLGLFGLLLALVGLLLTGTRALMGGAVVGGAVGLAINGRKGLGFVLAMLMGMVFIFVQSYGPSLADEYRDFSIVRSLNMRIGRQREAEFIDYSQQDTLRWRFELWEDSIREIRKQPWMGQGFAGRHAERLRYRTMGESERYHLGRIAQMESGATHNLWLAPFLVFGIPAGLLFCLYVAKAMHGIFRINLGHRAPTSMRDTGVLLAVWSAQLLTESLTSGGAVAVGLFLMLAIAQLWRLKLREVSTEQPNERPTEAGSVAI